MRPIRTILSIFLALCCFVAFNPTIQAQNQAEENFEMPPPPHAKEIHLKHVLVIGQTKGFEHDSVSERHGCHLQHGPQKRFVGHDAAHRHRAADEKRPGEKYEEPELL